MSALKIQNRLDEMRIYVADLACYNNGILSGKWIDLPSDDIDAEVQSILDKGTSDRKAAGVYDGVPSEEWAIHDFEAPFEINEYDDLDDINQIAREFEVLNEQDIKKVSYLINYQGASIDEAFAHYEDIEIYEDMSYLDLAEQLIDETWEVPEHIAPYIDYEKFARELELDYVDINGDLYYSQY